MRSRRLIVVTPEGERELLFIGRLTVGRAPECDISLADTKISRRHAEFDASAVPPRITDLGSRNGILVNGHKVGAADLVPGDVVTIGDARIRLEEGAADVPEPAAAPADDERTTILPPMSAQPRSAILAPPSAAAGPPHLQPPPPLPPPLPTPDEVASAGLDSSGENASVISPRLVPRRPAGPSPSDPPTERTSLLPPPQRPASVPEPIGPSPAAKAAAPEAAADVLLHVAPAPAPIPPPKAAPPPMPVPVPSTAVGAAAVPGEIAVSAAPAAPAAPAAAVPPAGVDIPVAAAGHVAPAAAPATGSTLKVPRISWTGLVTVAVLLLAGLAVLFAALPLMSAWSSTLDTLSQRQAQTLAGWLAAGVDPHTNPVVDPRVMEAVLLQPGVERAMVLERATGRALAPATVRGRSYSALPGLGETWRVLTEARVSRADASADAYVLAGDGSYVAWVRYQQPSSSGTGRAIMVALVTTLVLGLLIALLITRHARATLQHFTRQVELAVSGASPKVMQGTLMPGLDRLPAVVTHLLEQHRAGAAASSIGDAQALVATDDPGLPAVASPQFDPGPPWLEVTPSLMVTAASAHGPAAGAAGWSQARGRHLLDVLDNGPMRSAVVHGLGSLGMLSGSEATVPLPGSAPIALRRESSGRVRVTLGVR